MFEEKIYMIYRRDMNSDKTWSRYTQCYQLDEARKWVVEEYIFDADMEYNYEYCIKTYVLESK